MAKTNAEEQTDYRERKKLVSDEFLEKERKRQKTYYVKTSQLKKNELKKRREAVKERVRQSQAQKKALIETIREDNESCLTVDTDRNFSPMTYLCSSQNQVRLPEKEKRRSDDRLYKLKKERQQLIRKCDSLRKKLTRSSSTVKINSPLTPKRKTMKMMKNAGTNPCNASEIQKQLLFAETISKEIQGPVNEKKNKKEYTQRVFGKTSPIRC